MEHRTEVVAPGGAVNDLGERPPGLSSSEVEARRRRGEVNDVPERRSRTIGEIVRANVFTRFNALLGGLLVVILIVGPIQDALFAGVLISNTAIGIIQEIRAKRTLDRLAVLAAPRARVVREGSASEVGVSEVVLDDVLEVTAGDQVVVDGTLLATRGLEVDESLLTGESEPVAKGIGDEVLSGSFVSAGTGWYRATRVGHEAYARQLAEEARRFTLVRSELRSGIDSFLRLVTWLLLPVAGILLWSQLTSRESLADALRGSVAGVGSMIPEGLVLLTSIAFAVGVVRLGKRRVLVQELPAIEGLARVDVVCLDKTGTLTSGQLRLVGVELLDDDVPARQVLGALATADPHPNASLRAVGEGCGSPGWTLERAVPFSSARKWSAARFRERPETWYLGAPEVVVQPGREGEALLRERVEEKVGSGQRVLVLAAGSEAPGEALPAARSPVALVVLEEQVRDDAAATLRYFAGEGVEVKVLSGDHPVTVGTVAGRLGLPGAEAPVDARELPDDVEALGLAMERGGVFGRVVPHQKRAMVKALQARGHVVAMTGDGVNDVLALKDADIGVAMGSGSSAARAVAQLVTLDDSFDALPSVVAEGRRVIANIERVGNLFLTKTVYAFLLALAIGVAALPFPFYPRHLTIVSSVTIGIPAFFLALAPNARRARPGFVARVLRFAIPAGTVAAAATFAAYALAEGQEGVSLVQSRTTATLVLCGVGLWILVILARPFTPGRRLLVGGMVAVLVAVLVLPVSRTFFALKFPPAVVLLAGVGIVALAGVALDGGWRTAAWVHARWDEFRERGEVRSER